MTVQIPQAKREAIFGEYLRFQDKIAKVAEKEHKAQLRRRRYVLDAFGKWLDKTPRDEVDAFLEKLSGASSTADSKRLADYLANLPLESDWSCARTLSESQTATIEKPRTHHKEGN